MKEYIEKGAYIDAMHGDYRDIELVKNFPTADVVEVVRCDKCKHCDTVHIPIGRDGAIVPYCKKMDRTTEDDFFCKYGEHREELE